MKRLTLFIVAVSLTGCSAKYGCKGMPDDPTCISAVEAYKATDKAKSTVHSSDTAPTASETAATAMPEISTEPAPIPKIDDPTPIRTPAKVMRIWVAPWEDADGDLNVSGYVFTELEQRRWMIGRSAPAQSPTISPLQVLHRAKEDRRPSASTAEDGKPNPFSPLNAGSDAANP
ncbi:TraV family lipoprotein [Methylococcus sp. EFPC2]|uniref:TraV family lipoprotein n=1 Tax=Methylococcus sp. EFPC2 TaxID=2812648 RepID=UPI001967B791|nr:TraV family lipoprotein [Methylococcus sp. EFPC2]QSA98086.1 TraV family lipoprotein [Methylococcus sp. EFPC2]